jgi:hypothetical protein
MFNIRKIIEDEVKKYFDAHLEGLSAKTYDEEGNMISSSYFYKIEDGHWVNIKTNKEFDAFSEHIRTSENLKLATSSNGDIHTLDTNYDKANLFKTRGDSRFDRDVVSQTRFGILVARK